MRLQSEAGDRRWLRNLCELAQLWVFANGGQENSTKAYVDLIFAFGLARLADTEAARELVSRADTALAGKDDAHAFLLEAFRHRIKQALDGRPNAGPLPAELLDVSRRMFVLFSYVADRLRGHSRILEPDQQIDPFRKLGPHISQRISNLDSQLAELTDLADPKKIEPRLRDLLVAHPPGPLGDPAEARTRIILEGLRVAPLVGEEFAGEMLDLSLTAYDALPETANISSLFFLEKMLSVAAHFNSARHIHQQVTRFEKMLQGRQSLETIQMLGRLADPCFRGLRQVGMRDQIDNLLTQMANLVRDGKRLEALDAAELRALLPVAGEWYLLGCDSQAEPVLQAAWALLLRGVLRQNDQTHLACAYASAAAQAPVRVAQRRLEDIFTDVKGVTDTYTTQSHFTISQLDLVETVVLGVTAGSGVPEPAVNPTITTTASSES